MPNALAGYLMWLAIEVSVTHSAKSKGLASYYLAREVGAALGDNWENE